jgi:hypothetical protein
MYVISGVMTFVSALHGSTVVTALLSEYPPRRRIRMDDNGYPSDEELKAIEEYDLPGGVEGLVDMIKDLWHYECGFVRKGKVLELHTGGWSGNEDIIDALERNMCFFMFYWQKSERGGHHYFEITDFQEEK